MTAAAAGVAATSASERKRIAVIATVVRRGSHALHFLNRLLFGYGWKGNWHLPALEVASLYVDQHSGADLARTLAPAHGIELFPSVTAAISRGGDRLAVDGILIVGEHGEYPADELGRTL